MVMDETYPDGDEEEEEEEEEELEEHMDESGQERSAGGHHKPRAVHQCHVCNKIFVSFKGLQQHAIIHTDQKPFVCDICSKAFRFKSNLFEHRSVHANFTPHACPYCGKTCRLKGNLKKHLKTHVQSKEDLDEAWRPFASNRRAPAGIPHDAIIVRSTGEPSSLFTPPSRPRKRKLGLGIDSKVWIEKIRRGDILPSAPIHEKMHRLEELIRSVEEHNLSFDELFIQARALPFERFDCPLCKSVFMSRRECFEHLESEHPNARMQRPLFCETCLKSFADKKSMEQHESYHKRVQMLIEHGDLQISEPEILLPQAYEEGEEEIENNLV
ncbi:unnamed protein product, partial [Sphagnum compactum]